MAAHGRLASRERASNEGERTDVTIENETLKIDLHPESADVEVRYRMHNTGPNVQQDFFFPVERWGKNPDADTDEKRSDIDHYQISVNGKDLSEILCFLQLITLAPDESIKWPPVSSAKLFERRLCRARFTLGLEHHIPVRAGQGGGTAV